MLSQVVVELRVDGVELELAGSYFAGRCIIMALRRGRRERRCIYGSLSGERMLSKHHLLPRNLCGMSDIVVASIAALPSLVGGSQRSR